MKPRSRVDRRLTRTLVWGLGLDGDAADLEWLWRPLKPYPPSLVSGRTPVTDQKKQFGGRLEQVDRY
jgi:hypothetical protein